MTSDDRFGGTVSVWLEERAGTGAPDYLDDILGRTARTRQRPGWTSIERWPPMDISANRTALPSRFPTRSLALLAIIGLLLARPRCRGSPGRRFAPEAAGTVRPRPPTDRWSMQDAGDIHVAATDGTSRVLVAGPTNDVSPWFSNDGTKFAFLREEGDELFRAHGRRLRGRQCPIVDRPKRCTSPTGGRRRRTARSSSSSTHWIDARVISIVDADEVAERCARSTSAASFPTCLSNGDRWTASSSCSAATPLRGAATERCT